MVPPAGASAEGLLGPGGLSPQAVPAAGWSPYSAGHTLSQENAGAAGAGNRVACSTLYFLVVSELRIQSLPIANLFFRVNNSLLLLPFSPRMMRGRITSGC